MMGFFGTDMQCIFHECGNNEILTLIDEGRWMILDLKITR